MKILFAPIKVNDEEKIDDNIVNDYIVGYEPFKIGDKTAIVKATLKNGFVIIESSSCVDPKDFNMSLGTEICISKIRAKVWELLGFLLQTTQYKEEI